MSRPDGETDGRTQQISWRWLQIGVTKDARARDFPYIYMKLIFQIKILLQDFNKEAEICLTELIS